MSEQADDRFLRWSLVFVWLTTACVSVWELQGQSRTVLAGVGLADPVISLVVIWCGASVDAVLGLALLFAPSRRICLAALTVMLLMTLVATILDPSLWLHPLGPLTKNLPIAAILWVLAKARS